MVLLRTTRSFHSTILDIQIISQTSQIALSRKCTILFLSLISFFVVTITPQEYSVILMQGNQSSIIGLNGQVYQFRTTATSKYPTPENHYTQLHSQIFHKISNFYSVFEIFKNSPYGQETMGSSEAQMLLVSLKSYSCKCHFNPIVLITQFYCIPFDHSHFNIGFWCLLLCHIFYI